MAMAMVVNGKVFKVAAGICGLLLTVYALYVYREVTAELQQCGTELSGAHQQYSSAQNVVKDLEEDARQARSTSSECQKTYAKLVEDSAKRKVEAEQNIKKLHASLDVERKAKDDIMAERDLLSARCTSEAQSLHTQLDTSQKKCAEDKSQMQNRLDEVISHSEIVDKQQQICTDDKDKLTNEKATLKAQNDDLMLKLKSLQQQVKYLLEKAKTSFEPKVPFDSKNTGLAPNKLPQPQKQSPPEKEKRGLPLPVKDIYSYRKTVDAMHSDGKFAPAEGSKSDVNQRPVRTTISLLPVHGGDLVPGGDTTVATTGDGHAAEDKHGDQEMAIDDKEKEENVNHRGEDNQSEQSQGDGGVKQEGVADPKEGESEGGDDGDDEGGPNKPQDMKAWGDDGLLQQQQDMKAGALEERARSGREQF